MAKTRSGIIKRYAPKPSISKKKRLNFFFKSSKIKKIIVQESKSNSDSDTLVEIDNYETVAPWLVKMLNLKIKKADSRDEESSKDTRDNGDGDYDPLWLLICAREISGKSYNLMTQMDDLGSFPTKNTVRERIVL